MKKLTILLLTLALSVAINAQKTDLVGSWLMTKAEIGKKIEEPYFVTSFKEDGKMESMGLQLGTWKYNKKTIIMESKFDKDFNGKSNILKLTKDELIIEKDGNKFFYRKLDEKKIAEDNKKSQLIGFWKVTGEPDITNFIQFSLPDSFLFVKSEGGVTDKIRGSWIFDSKTNSIVVMSFSQLFKGKNKIKKLNENELILERNGKIIKATKENPKKIERLTFVYEDFDENSDDSGKLPWREFYDMIETLKDLHYLKYKKGDWMPDISNFKYSTIISKIKVNTEKENIMITNLQVTQNDTMQFSQNYKGGLTGRYDLFYPKAELMPYRVVKTEKITVPAGTFDCTVIEGLDGERKVKYWMINDKPGIYAKIISEQLSVFDNLEYYVMELEEIK